MKKLLLFICATVLSASVFGQTVCPDNLICHSSTTVFISELTTIAATDLLENGLAYEQCSADKVFTSYSISTLDGDMIRSYESSHNIDCSFSPGKYKYAVSRVEILPDGKLGEGINCFGEIELIDQNNICSGLSGSYDINVILDCTSTDIVGVAGDFIEANKNENVCVSFFAKDFIDMAGYQTGFVWNPSVLDYTETKPGALIDIAVNEIDAQKGELKFVWVADLSVGQLTVADNESLFELCFDVVGEESEYSKVSMLELSNLPIEFTKIQDEVKESDYCLSPALVNVIGSNQVSNKYTTIINGEEIASNQYNIVAIPSSKIKSGENIIEFVTNNENEYLNGVSTLDLVLGLKMFVLDDPIDPIQAIALDVDYSGGINVKDLVLMRQLILGIRADLPHPGKFFLRQDHVFPDDFDEFDFGYFNSYTFDADEYNEGQLYFKSYYYGDLNGSAYFKNDNTEIRSSSEKLVYEDSFLRSGEIVKVKFSLDGQNSFEINGLQGSLLINDAEILNVDHDYTGSEFLTHMPLPGVVNLLFADQEAVPTVEFELEIRSSTDGFLSEMISLGESMNIELVKDDLSTSGLVLNPEKVTNEDFEISPNPFNEYTTVKVPSEYIGGKMIVNDVLGKKLYEVAITESKVTIVKSDLYFNGLYLVSLEKGNRTITKRVILN